MSFRSNAWLRWGIGLGLLVIVAGILVVALSDDSSKPAKTANCSGDIFRIRFLPSGTTSNSKPQIDVFPGATGSMQTRFRVAYADPSTFVGGRVCNGPLSIRQDQMRQKVRTSSPVTLVCDLGDTYALGPPHYDPAQPNQFYDGTFEVRGARNRILYAFLKPSGLSDDGSAVLQYDATICSKKSKDQA